MNHLKHSESCKRPSSDEGIHNPLSSMNQEILPMGISDKISKMTAAQVLIFKCPSDHSKGLVAVVAMLCNSADRYSLIHRHLKHRGITELIATRDMDEIEKEEHCEDYRLYSIGYKSWEALVKDEYKITNDEDFCNKIIKGFSSKISLTEILNSSTQQALI